MLEYSIIQTRGFTNVAEDGRVTGFRLLVRMPNYRGAWGSLLDGADVTVDGRAFSRDSTRWTLRGRTFTLTNCGVRPTSTGISPSPPRSRCRWTAAWLRVCTTWL